MISKRTYRRAIPFLFLACFFIRITSSAQTTFFTDQCDDTTPWTLGAGTPSGTYGEYSLWKIGNSGCGIDGSSLSVNAWNRYGSNTWYCEYVETSAADIIAKRTINASTFQILQLQFDWICSGESAGGNVYDYGQVGYSTNGGSTFTWLTTGGGAGNGKYYGSSSIVRNQSIALPVALNNTSFVIGFRWINNASVTSLPGFIVDNIRVSGQLIGGGTPETPKVTLLFDECKNDKGWILGKGPVFDGTSYTAWRIGNDTLCTIDMATLSIGTWNRGASGTWACGYLEFIPTDIKACKKIDARNYENLELQFDWSCQAESYPTIHYDYGEVGYSTDGGATFTWFGVGGTDGLGNYYGSVDIQRGQHLTFPAALNGKEFLVAFRWVNDESVQGIPGFTVDNIKVSGSAKATQLATIFKDNLDTRTGWQLKKAATDPAGNTLAWNIDRRCSIDGNSLAINLYNNSTKQWDCGFATNAAADIVASRFINASSASNLFLKFDWKVTSTTSTDYAQVGYSTDGGTTFTWLAYGGTANSGKYYNQATLIKSATVKLPNALDGKDFDLGIRWVNDASTNSGQAIIIDNISVIGEPTTGIPPLPDQPKINRITNEYVKVVAQKTEANVNALTEDGKTVEKNYFDGNDRKIQQVIWKASPLKNDLVQPTLYDENGNAGTHFLPYKAATTDAGYHPDMLNEQYTYNNAAKANFSVTEYAYNQALTELSPANRVTEAGSIGKEFQPGTPGTTRTVTQKFYNAIDNNPPTVVEAIKLIKLGAGPSLSINYYTAPAEPLLVTEITDEDKKIKRTYTNNKGQLILERQYATDGTTILTQTYYVYDEFDRLRVVIQPEGLTAANMSAVQVSKSSSFMDTYCFQYNYDDRGRLISKKTPGAGWVQLAYDRWDRPVISQDANQAAKNPQEFTYVKYDVQNRPMASGTFKAANRTLTIDDVRTELTNTSLGARYETRTLGTLPNMDFTGNLTYPKADATNTLTPLTQSYYDDYKYTDLVGFAFTPYLSYTAASAVTNTRGMVTAMKTNVLGTSTWLTTVNYYDGYDRVIQTQQKNINGVKNFLTTEYDFQGHVLKTVEDNKLTTTSLTLQTTNAYDHMGRLTRVLHKTNAQTEVVLADYKYTDLGTKVSEKNLYSTNGGTSYTQSVDYTFNEKGWLTNINNADLSNDGITNNDANDIFGMQFNYYKNQLLDATKALYNGNISEAVWNSSNGKKQGYLYTYDDVNRLTSASYRNLTTTSENNRYNVGSITYDANGNIKTLQQSGLITGTTTFGLMDNLTYTYTGNKLFTISDAVAATSYPYDFQNGSNPAVNADYSYDANGNLTADDNKGITSISYNLLNLPEQIIQASGKKTIFTYDALGTKLRKQEYTGTTLTLTSDYLGSVQYLNGSSQFAGTGEGRVYNNSGTYRYDYFMKDQVGNIRMTYTANGTGVTVLQRDEYYPFGNTFDSYLGSGGANTYKFNGMELEENNLNTFDFHARMYDPQIGRSFQPDPHADAYASKSPFSFLGNNPICITDPTGMDEEGDGNGGGGGGGGGDTGSGIGPWFLSSGGYSSVSNGRPGRGDLYYDYVKGTYKLDGMPISNAQAMALIRPYLAPIMKETIDIYILHPDGTKCLSNTYYKYSLGEKGEGGWIEPANKWNGGIGVLAGVVENLSGSATVANNITTWLPGRGMAIEVSRIGKIASTATLIVGTAFDAVGVYNYYRKGADDPDAVNPGKAGLNLSVGVWGLLNPTTAVGAVVYYGVDTFYPGGWPAAMQKSTDAQSRDRAILGYYPKD
jgi:RHS repeat-associated protein